MSEPQQATASTSRSQSPKESKHTSSKLRTVRKIRTWCKRQFNTSPRPPLVFEHKRTAWDDMYEDFLEALERTAREVEDQAVILEALAGRKQKVEEAVETEKKPRMHRILMSLLKGSWFLLKWSVEISLRLVLIGPWLIVLVVTGGGILIPLFLHWV